MINDPLEMTVKASIALLTLLVYPSLVAGQTPDVLPAIFDDFEYDSADFNLSRYRAGRQNFDGSVFGSNEWMTPDGLQRARAWRRFNWDDLNFSCSLCGVETIDDGRISLIVPAGGVTGGSEHRRLPAISSGFVTGGGTYAARIRMNSLPEQGNYIQAFWTSGIDVLMIDQGSYWLAYLSETDIESFSRSYTGNNRVDFGVTNYLGKRMRRDGDDFRSFEAVIDGRYGVRSGDLQCVEGSGDGQWTHLADCREVLFDRDWIMSISIQPREFVEYSLRSADGRYAAGAVESRRGVYSVTPIRISNFSPPRPVIALFGLYSDGQEQHLSTDLSLEVDWYYHTRHHISIDEVLEQVQALRSIHPRVNTLGMEFHDVTSQSRFDVAIQGPRVLPYGRTGGWRLDLTPLNTTYIAERFEYSFLDCSDSDAVIVHGPTPIRTPEIVLAVPPENDGIVIEATVRNYWSGLEREVRKVVSVEGRDCSVLLGN